MPKIKVIRPTEEIKKELAELEENIQTAAASLASGSEAVILKHPQAVATISKMIQELM